MKKVETVQMTLHCSPTHSFNHLSRVIHLRTENLLYSSGLLEQHTCIDECVGGNLETLTVFYQRRKTVSTNQEHKKLYGKIDSK